MAEGDLPGCAVTIPFFVAPCIPFLFLGCWPWRDLAGISNGAVRSFLKMVGPPRKMPYLVMLVDTVKEVELAEQGMVRARFRVI